MMGRRGQLLSDVASLRHHERHESGFDVILTHHFNRNELKYHNNACKNDLVLIKVNIDVLHKLEGKRY